MTFDPKDWQDYPSTATPLDAAALVDLETRLSAYTDDETTRAESEETTLATAISTETSRAEAAEATKAPLASPTLTGTPTAPTASPLTDNTQVATTAYTDLAVGVETTRAETAEALKAPLASPALTGTPTAPTPSPGDSTTKISTTAFVSNAVAAGLAGIPSRDVVIYATATALPSNTYSNGTSGVGATLTATANGALSVDGQTVSSNQRILVQNEVTSANNGIYVVTQVGSSGTPYILTRSADFDTAAQMGTAVVVPVDAEGATPGTNNNGKVFLSLTSSPFTVGTTSITFAVVGSTYSNGYGITLSGTVFSINTGVVAQLASPAFTGTPTAPTASALTDNTQIATTAYTDTAVGVETTRAEAAEALKAPLASPALTGTPTAPTQTTGDNTTKIATDQFVTTAVAVETTRAEAAESTNATAISTETSRAEAAEALKAPLASPALTGSPTAPTQTTGDNTTKIATDQFVTTAVGVETTRAEAAEGLLAPKASPTFTGVPIAPTATALTDNTQIATTAYTDSAVAVETTRAETAEALKAPLAALLAGLPVESTVTGTGILVANAYNPASAASGPYTLNMPSTAGLSYGALCFVEKSESSTNQITLSGTFRGVVGTLTLSLNHEVKGFFYEGSGSWRPFTTYLAVSSIVTPQSGTSGGNLPYAYIATWNGATDGTQINNALTSLGGGAVTVFTTLTANTNAPTSWTISALPTAVPANGLIKVTDSNGHIQSFTLSAAASAGATTLSISSGQLVNASFATASSFSAVVSAPGVVFLPSGTAYIDSTVVIASNQSLVGAGKGATVLKAANSLNADVIQTYGFSALTGTTAYSDTTGAVGFELHGFTIDGNRSNNTSGRGISVYGYGYTIDDLEIRNAANDGMWTEYGTPSGNVPDTIWVESLTTNLSIHDNGWNGWHHLSPTDCRSVDVVVFDNNQANATQGTNVGVGVWLGSGAGGLQAVNLHIYGTNHTWGLVCDGSIMATNLEVEGAYYGQILGRNQINVVGGRQYGAGSYAESCGIQLGDTGTTLGLSIGTLSTALSTSGTTTSLQLNAGISLPLASGSTVTTTSGSNTQTWTLTAPAALNATSLTVSATANYAYPSGTAVGNSNFPQTSNTGSTGSLIVTTLDNFLCDVPARAAINWQNASRSRVITQTTVGNQPTQSVASASNGVDISTFTGSGSLTVNNNTGSYFIPNSTTTSVPLSRISVATQTVTVSSTLTNGSSSGSSVTLTSSPSVSIGAGAYLNISDGSGHNQIFAVTSSSGATVNITAQTVTLNTGSNYTATVLYDITYTGRSGTGGSYASTETLTGCTTIGTCPTGTTIATNNAVTLSTVQWGTLVVGGSNIDSLSNISCSITGQILSSVRQSSSYHNSFGQHRFVIGAQSTGFHVSTDSLTGSVTDLLNINSNSSRVEVNQGYTVRGYASNYSNPTFELAAATGQLNLGSSSGSATDTFLTRVAAGVFGMNGALSMTGLTGATSASRYVGSTASGAPASGTFAVGDFIIDHTGYVWVCTVAGTPGTWVNAAGVTSFNSRTGAITPTTGDYTAAQVTNAADKSSASVQTFTGNLAAPAHSATGLTGATAGTRYVGATNGGAPTSGTFVAGDYVIDFGTPAIWIYSGSAWTQPTASATSTGYVAPAMHGLAAMNQDPALVTTSGYLLTAATHYVFKMTAQYTQTVSKVFIPVSGTGSPANTYVALYTQAGALISGSPSTTDQSTTWNATGNSIALSLGTATNVTAGTNYYVSLYFASGTAPGIYRSSGTGIDNLNLTSSTPGATSYRWATASNTWTSGTPYTAPSTLGTLSVNLTAPFIGLG